jgi:hypothetical protein
MRTHTAEPTPEFHEKLLLWKSGGELGALNLRGYETRNESVLALVAEAERRHGLPEFAPLTVHTGDQPINTGDAGWRSLAFSRAEGFLDIAVPDFLFDGWPQVGIDDYEQACSGAARAGETAALDSRLGWIGNCDTNPVRWQLHALGAVNPELLEITDITWVPEPEHARLSTAAGNYLTIEQQITRWALLLDIEGRGYSARLKLLLHSGRPLLVQDRPWQEFFWPALEPWAHFIPVRRDLGDLLERVAWAREHPDEAAAIGRAGQLFARAHLSRGAAVAEWATRLAMLAEAPQLPYAPPAACRLLDPVLRNLGAID